MILRLVAFALLGVSALLRANDSSQQVITLKDKSVIRAQVTEVSGGFYLVKSPVLGEIKIPTGEVASIHNEETAAQSTDAPAAASNVVTAGAQPSPGAAGLESLRSALSSKVQSFVSTSDGMSAVMEFSRNPDVKALLNDPQVMQAIQNGDYNTLMKSPAMKNLLDNPRTKSFIQSVLTSQAATQATATPKEPTSTTK